jgi:hypothetical protein
MLREAVLVDWVTVMDIPATARAALRGVVPEFGEAVKLRAPFPVPEVGLVGVSQAGINRAPQLHPAAVVMDICTEPPEGGI